MSIARHRELLVLSTLRAHPMHGYRLVEVLEGGLGRALGLKRAAVYAILKRLAERGWIEGETERDGRHPERSVYRITPAGEAGLPALAEASAKGDAGALTPLAVTLAHLDLIDGAARRSMLERLRRARQRDLASLGAFAEHDGHIGGAFELMVAQLRVEIDALDAVLREMPPTVG